MSPRHFCRCLVLSFVLAAVVGVPPLAPHLLAQTSQRVGRLAGTVFDESMQTIADASVVVVAGSGVTLAAVVTTRDGTFDIPNLPVGTLRVIVQRVGFETTDTQVDVSETSNASLSVVLAIASFTEALTVTGVQLGDKLSLEAAAPTSSRLGLTIRETPASVTLVDRITIERRGATDTQEILSSVPGVSAASPPGSAGSVSYRGFGASQLTQLFNGITVQYDAIAARPVDSWLYDRVEVIGGPSTFLFGAGAVGGSINYVTKLADRYADSADVRVSAGSYATTEFSGGFNRRLGRSDSAVRHAVRADLSRTHTDGYVAGNERTSVTSAASLLTDFGANVSHTLAVEYQNEAVDRPYWGTPLLTPTTGVGRIDPATRFTNYNSRDGIYEQTVGWARSIVDARLSNRIRLRNTLYYYDALRDYRNVEVYRYNAANTAVTRSSPLLQRHDQNLFGNRVEAQFRASLGRMESDWAAGFDVSRNEQTRFPRSLTLTVGTVDPLVFSTESFFDIPGMVPGFVPDRTNEVTTAAFFLENRTKLPGRLSLVTGLRRDRIALAVTNKRTVTATDPAYFKNVYTPVTGRVGLTYSLRPSANLYAQFSTAADPPAGILTTANFAAVRDFDLTSGRQVEVGSKFDFWRGRGVATLAGFRIVRKNLAIADPDNPGTTLPIGQQSSRGFEAAVSVRATSALLLQGNYSHIGARYDDFIENVGGVAVSRAGNTPPNTPSRIFNLWAAYTLTRAWELGADIRYVADRFGNTANTIEGPAYTLVGGYVTYQLTKSASLTARARNLTDEIYARSITGTPMFFLGAPRTFEVALRVGL